MIIYKNCRNVTALTTNMSKNKKNLQDYFEIEIVHHMTNRLVLVSIYNDLGLGCNFDVS